MGLLSRVRGERTVIQGGRVLVSSNFSEEDRWWLNAEDEAIEEEAQGSVVEQAVDSAQTVAAALIEFLRGKGSR